VAALPVGAAAITAGAASYWYLNGVYFANQGAGYVVVPPVEGAVVPEPPSSCLTVGDDYDCNGAFYSEVSNGYRVIPPPIGVTVPSLPDGAVKKTINGASYFAYGDAWYQPTYHNGGVSYKVVAKPA
jgi:hypothetical protein